MKHIVVGVLIVAACSHQDLGSVSRPRPAAVATSQPSSIAPLVCGLRGRLDPSHRAVCHLRDADSEQQRDKAFDAVMRIGPSVIPVLREMLRDRRTHANHRELLERSLYFLETVKANTLQVAPNPTFSVNASLEDKIVYLGFDMDSGTNNNVIIPNTRVTFIHYWKVLESLEGWRLLVHLKGSKAGFINADHTPVFGTHPVTRWRPGEIVRDEHRVTLPRCWRQPRVNLLVGLWKGRKRMKPLTANDGTDRVEAGSFAVKVLPGCKP